MTMEVKERLIDILSQTHADTRALLKEIDMELRVYPSSSWRIKDVISHLAIWDRQVTKALKAYRLGKEYLIPNLDMTAFNEKSVMEHQALTSDQVIVEWDNARREFIQAVNAIPLDHYPGDLLYPWGDERGTIAHMVETMVDHDIEHQNEIRQAIESGK